MIQRIQTLYLLGALALILICCFVPIAVLTGNINQDLPLSLLELTLKKSSLLFEFVLLFLLGFTAFIIFISIFLYKRRKTQMKQCVISTIALVILNLTALSQLLYLKHTGMTVVFHIASVFPLLAAVCTWLAYGRIKKDENLVKSYDRLR